MANGRLENQPPQPAPAYGLVEGGDPFARKTTRVSTDYPGWAQEEMETLEYQGRHNRHWDYAGSDGDGERNDEERGHWRDQRNVEQVIIADEGRDSSTATPSQDGRLPYDPRNNAVSKPTRNPAMYEMLRSPDDMYVPPQLNGYKTTLADNIRPLSVTGMRPQYRRDMRNTYRVEPEPWDQNIVELPDTPRPQPDASYYTTPPGSAFRLG